MSDDPVIRAILTKRALNAAAGFALPERLAKANVTPLPKPFVSKPRAKARMVDVTDKVIGQAVGPSVSTLDPVIRQIVGKRAEVQYTSREDELWFNSPAMVRRLQRKAKRLADEASGKVGRFVPRGKAKALPSEEDVEAMRQRKRREQKEAFLAREPEVSNDTPVDRKARLRFVKPSPYVQPQSRWSVDHKTAKGGYSKFARKDPFA